MCDSLQICLVGAVSTNILTPYGVKTAFAGKSGKYCVKFLRNWVLQIKILQHPLLTVCCSNTPTVGGCAVYSLPDAGPGTMTVLSDKLSGFCSV